MIDLSAFHIPDFRAHRLLPTGHLQTMAGTLLSRQPPARESRHEIELDDGDRTLVFDDCPHHWPADGTIVVMVHGIAGCAHSPYQVRLMTKLVAAGQRVLRTDLRGHGDSGDLAKGIGHAGRSNDALRAVQFAQRLAPKARILLLGFSMGGNIVLKLAAEQAADMDAVNLVVAVAPPVEIEICARNLSRGWNRVYGLTFIRLLKKQMKQRSSPLMRDAERILAETRPRTIFDFDDRITAPLSGFRDAVDYYTQASSAPMLARIQVPTIIFLAEDDPMIPPKIFDSLSTSKSTRIITTRSGGHIGYLGRRNSRDADRWWIDWRIIELANLLGDAA